MALKPLPKLIIIAAVVGAVGYALTNFLPKQQKAEQPSQAAPTIVPPTEVAPQAVAAPAPVEQPSNAPVQGNVSNGDAGLNAVLGAGKKGR